MTDLLPQRSGQAALPANLFCLKRRRGMAPARAGAPDNTGAGPQPDAGCRAPGSSRFLDLLKPGRLAATAAALLLTGALPLYGQAVKVWDKTLGGSAAEAVQTMQVTSDGGYILGGYSFSGISGDKTEALKGVNDYWVVKLHADGSKAWDKTIGGSGSDNLTALQQTSDGGYILGGISNSGISGDKSEASKGANDFWVVKLNADGSKAWDKTIGGGLSDNLYALQQTSDGGFLLGGTSSSGMGGDKTQACQGSNDFWVLKLRADGSVAWDKTFGGAGSDNLTCLQQTSDGGYLLGGYSNSGSSGDKTEASRGVEDFWVIKLGADGNKSWEKTLGGNGFDRLHALQENAGGDFILGGYSNSYLSGDKTQASKGENDFWVVNLRANGTIAWDKAFGGNRSEAMYALKLTSDGGYLLGGSSTSDINGDKSQASRGGNDFWVVKLQSDGTLQWEKTLGGDGEEAISSLQQNSEGDYVLAGYSFSGIIGDKTQASRGGRDFWVVKLQEVTAPAPLALAQELATQEDVALPIQLSGTDPQNQALTYALVKSPAKGSLSGTAPNLVYTPSRDFNGTDSFSFLVHNGLQPSLPATVSVAVSPVNDGPKLAVIPAQTAFVTVPYSFTFAATDVDTPASGLRFAVTGGPAGASLDAATGRFSWTPATSQQGTHTFQVEVSDGAFTAQQNVVLTVVVPLPADEPTPSPLFTIQWDKTLGGSSEELLQAMQHTADGGYILGGSSRPAITGGATQPGDYDYRVVKLNPDGSQAWEKTIGGASDDELTALQQTKDGGYILGGFSLSLTGGAKSENSDEHGDFWVVKLDANGNKVWDKTFGGWGRDYLKSLQQTADGGYILGGYSYSLYPGVGWPRSDSRYLVVKLNANGTVSWTKTFDGGGSDNLNALQQTADGGYLLGGSSNSGTSADKSEASKGGADYWVIRLSANGAKVWDKTFGSSGDDVLTALKETPDGGYLLGGQSAGDISGDKFQASRGGKDFWVLKIRADGTKEWDKTLGGQGLEALASIQLSADGGYLLGGTSSSAISGDKTQASKGGDDFWLVKLDVSGKKSWDAAFGGADNDQLRSFQPTRDGGYALAGTSISGISGDKTQAEAGAGDFWILKTGDISLPAVAGTSLRINAGGGQVNTPEGVFAGDMHFAPAPGFTYSSPTLIAGTDNDALYQSERSSPADNGSFGYALPLADGKYTVVLHFAELYWNAPGQRVFDVALEGALALDDYDIVKKTGGKNIATTETFLVTVTGGVLDINLSALAEEGGVNRPKISAIEVLSYTGSYAFPPAKAGADQTVTLPDHNLILDGRGTETHGRVDVFTWTQVSGPNRASFYRFTSAPSVFNLQPGTYVFSLTIMDDERAISAPDEVVITVVPDPNAPAVVATHRIHAGGGQLTAAPGIFAADNYFSNGEGTAYSPTTSSTTFPIANTQDDALYQTERNSGADNGAFSYDLPLANGSYTVVLHFAEIYWNARGQRVFDVAMEGNLVLDNYDIMKKTGVNFTATSESFVVDVADGLLNIHFSALASEGGVNRPKVSAIEVIPYAGSSQARTALEGGQAGADLASRQDLGLGVVAYPNPFNQEISLHMAGAPLGDYTVRMLDLVGKQVYQSRFQVSSGAGQVQTISLQGAGLNPGGLYLLVVEQASGGLRQVIRMVKQ